MQISSRFTMAVHVFTCIDTFKDERRITSDFLAGSINVNPVIVRRLMSQLKAARLIRVKRGSGGICIARPLDKITLLDVYNAVECVKNGELFHFHENSNPDCPVGRNIHRILDDKLQRVQKAMESEMQKITLADVMRDTRKYVREPSSCPQESEERTCPDIEGA